MSFAMMVNCWKYVYNLALILALFVVQLTCGSSEHESLETGVWLAEETAETLTPRRGSEVVLNCSVSTSGEFPAANVTWRKDGQPLAVGLGANQRRGRLLSVNGSVVIRRVQARADNGVYQCVVSVQGLGVVLSAPTTLHVAEMGRFIIHPESVTVVAGETARLQCVVYGVPTPVISWTKDGRSLPESNRYVELTSLGVLQLENVEPGDQGTYRCVATNDARVRRSNDARLHVNAATGSGHDRELLVRPVDVDAKLGDTVVLECAARRYDAAGISHVTWTRSDGSRLPGSRTQRIGRGNLEISSIAGEDAGLYRCSLGGAPDVYAEALLSVLVPPTAVQPMRNQMRSERQSVQVSCNVSGEPTPSVSWTKNGEDVVPSSHVDVRGRDLVIGQAAMPDSGIYQCWAENIAGHVVLTARVLVQMSEDGPDPPTAVEARVISSRSIEVSWEKSPPKFDLQTIAYSVHYAPSAGGAELQKVVQETRVNIDQLTPFTNYSFYVRAYNARSKSRPSAVVTRLTQEDVPAVLPEAKVSTASPTSLKVEWNALSPDQARGIIVHHQLIYRRRGSQTQHTVDLPGDVYEHVITGLESGLQYDVVVLAATRTGFPSVREEDWLWVSHLVTGSETLASVSTVPNANVEVLGPEEIRVSWDPVSQDSVEPGILLGFKIHYESDGEPRRTIILVENVVEHTIPALKRNTTYHVSLGLFTDQMEGELTSWTVHTPPAPSSLGPGDVTPPHSTSSRAGIAPPPPPGLEAESVNETVIKLSWKESVYSLSPVTSYTILYMPFISASSSMTGLSLDDSSTSSVISFTTHAVIQGLKPFTFFRFAICSHADSVIGPFGDEIRCRTAEGRPSAPRQLTWLIVGSNGVHLSWLPPAEPNGIISSYVISYCSSDSELGIVSTTTATNCHMQHVHGSAIQTSVQGLQTSVLYQFWMQAVTGAGPGDATDVIRIITPSEKVMSGGSSDRLMGIVIGVSISSGCIVVCVIIILLRNRCIPASQSAAFSNCQSNGPVFANGCVCHEMPPPALYKSRSTGLTPDGVACHLCTQLQKNGLHTNHVDAKGCMPNGCCRSGSGKLISDHQYPYDTYVMHDGHVASCTLLNSHCSSHRGSPRTSVNSEDPHSTAAVSRLMPAVAET